MGNHTVNRKIGKAAGINDIVRVTGMKIMKKEREMEAEGKIDRSDLMRAGEFLSIKAYIGGNPNKKPIEKADKEEMTH